MQGGRGVKIVIFMALRCKVMENTRKTEGAWGKSFSGPPRGPEEQRTYEQRTRLIESEAALLERVRSLKLGWTCNADHGFHRLFKYLMFA